MTPRGISKQVVAERVQWVETMLGLIRDVPVEDKERFHADPRNALACESCLRRALEALMDLGRHILAKGFGHAVEEYRQIGPSLAEKGVVNGEAARVLRVCASYRNRMVHFYREITSKELREICSKQLGDVEMALDGLKEWLANNTEGQTG